MFSVPFDYRVIFSNGVFDRENSTLADVLMAASEPTRLPNVVVFRDSNVTSLHSSGDRPIENYFAKYRDRCTLQRNDTVPGGEQGKRDSRVVDQVVQTLHDEAIDRHSYVIAVGGGAVLDAVGYAASIVHRGIRHIRIPTTVLAQNDAGIGVKNGIDYLGKKNFLGCFQPPVAVINDFSLLATLSRDDRRNGFSEALKVGLLRDPAFFEWIDRSTATLVGGDDVALAYLIRRCAELHIRHITTTGDPFERGSARPLDFGHWAAHKLEQLSDFAISHGHAVAAGLAIDVLYAKEIGLLPPEIADRIVKCLRNLGFPLAIGAKAKLTAGDVSPILIGLAEFQQHLGGRLSITTLKGIGEPVELSVIDREAMTKCVINVLFGD